MLGFAFIDYFEGDTLEMTLDVLIFSIFLVGAIGIKILKSDFIIYMFSLVLIGAVSLFSVYIGSGNGTVILWLFPFPIVFIFFLGIHKGGALFILFLAILSFIMINPFSLDIYSYDIGMSIRFLVSLLFLSLIAYGMEATREKYATLLTEKTDNLIEEKRNLEKALKENKTLRGLIPICSNCKKIRDDEGYWHQVEVYVRDHSDADFSHGICPDCFKKLYPGYEYVNHSTQT